MIQSWSIGRKLAAGLALGPIALIVIGALALTNTRTLIDDERTLDQQIEIRLAIRTITTGVLGAESAQRGYLLTANDSYLAPFDAAASAANKGVEGFIRLTATDPKQLDRAISVRSLVNAKLAELKDTVSLRRSRGFDAALAVVRTDRGKSIMDQIVALSNAAIAEVDGFRLKSHAADERSAAQTINAIVFGTVFLIAVLVLAAFLLIRNVKRPLEVAVAAITSATADILSGTSQQAAGVQEQAAAVAETVSTVEQISQTAEASSERARTVAETAQRAVENGTAGRQAVEDTVAVMASVKARTESIASNILSLAEQAQAIGEIIAVVTDVADQTNILALNAAIEASRAGEHGKGFSVVATEVKSLADQSKKATVQVRQILSDIQRATNGAVMATEQGAKTVDEAIRSVSEADDAIRMLAAIVAEAAQSATQISASVNQQSIGIAQIRRAMRDINETTAQSLTSTRQAEQAARDLDELGHRLQRLLDGAPA